MASSVTMAATTSFLSTTTAKQTPRRGLIVAKALSRPEKEKVCMEMNKRGEEEESSNGRRNLVFAAATVAACSVAKIAMADDEPKRGTPEAKKKYASICVTMPTARICKK